MAEDEDGKAIDVHAVRTRLITQLARAGVAPRLPNGSCGNSDYRTTLQLYTVLGLADSTGAIHALPSIAGSGTDPQRGAE